MSQTDGNTPLTPAYAMCPSCIQLSVWYTIDGQLPRHEQLACRWCGEPLDRERHKARPPERGVSWAQ